MSHFTVLVIGGNVEEQLAPFDENEVVDEYIREVVSDEEKERMLNFYKENYDFVGTLEECLEQKSQNWNESWGKDENGVWQEHSTYNPKSKWDWYSIGGRWSGFFKMKNGIDPVTGCPGVFNNQPRDGYGDVAKKKDIDFEGMKNDAGNKAGEYYDEIISIIGHLPEIESWDSIRERFENIDDAREFYHNQERVKALRDAKYWTDAENFQISREEYVENARNNAISTYAVVKDGEWYEKGQMGWWGMSSNEIDQNEWNKRVMELIDETDDETLFTLVDCHI